MRKAYRILGYVIAAEVVVQAMAIAFALAGLGKWIEDGGVLDSQTQQSDVSFTGVLGFAIHGINGEMVIPLLVIVLAIISPFARVRLATRLALVLVGLVILQVLLGMFLHGIPYLALLHAANAFGIAATAVIAARRAGRPELAVEPRGSAAAEERPAAPAV